jgi:hypothetical protein
MNSLSNEAFLTQLGYTQHSNIEAPLERVALNTNGFEYLKGHIIQLADSLKPYDGFVAISNSHDYLKVKTLTNCLGQLLKSKELIEKWAKKYKVKLEKLPNKDTYYIIGIVEEQKKAA